VKVVGSSAVVITIPLSVITRLGEPINERAPNAGEIGLELSENHRDPGWRAMNATGVVSEGPFKDVVLQLGDVGGGEAMSFCHGRAPAC
jgi:hypothetical protein